MTNGRCRLLLASLLFASAVALPAMADGYMPCPALEQPMLKVPEITRDASTNTLQAVLTVTDQERVVAFNTTAANPSIYCASQRLRFFTGYSPVHPSERWPVSTGPADPLPGPTLRARVGDLVQITFLNQVNIKNLPNSQYFDRDACDQVIGLYPSWDISEDGIAAADKFLTAPESEVPPALRRLVLEGQAGVKRSLRARRCDAGEEN